MEDKIILQSLANGDMSNFEYLVNSYEKTIHRFIYNMTHDKSITEDLTQDVFIKVYKNLYRYNSDYPIEPWLFKISYNVVLNHLKKNKNREVFLQENLHAKNIAEDNIESFETRDALLRELNLMKPDCRMIFILRIIDDLSFEQIASILGTSVASVKLKFYRNRKNLIDKLKNLLTR